MSFFAQSLNFITNFFLLVLPAIMAIEAFKAWIEYRRIKFIRTKLRPQFLKLTLPSEITKTPKSMEAIYAFIWQQNKGVGALDEVYVDGRVRPEVSLELVSIGGNVSYYLVVPPKMKDAIKSNLYSQFPGIEIQDVEDYLGDVDEILNHKIFHGMNFVKKGPSALPIVTYDYYGLDSVSKPEEKTDPLTQTLEFLSSLSYGEVCSIQHIIRPNKDEDWEMAEALPFKKKPGLISKVNDFVNDLVTNSKVTIQKDQSDKYELANYKPGDPELIKALRGLTDQDAFDVVLRGMYMANSDSFKGYNIANMAGVITQFSHAGANSIRPNWETDLTDAEQFTYRFMPIIGSWVSKKIVTQRRKRFLLSFKRRVAFYPPHTYQGTRSNVMELFSQELATIYHLVGTEASTPSLERVGANKSNPPGNLPV